MTEQPHASCVGVFQYRYSVTIVGCFEICKYLDEKEDVKYGKTVYKRE